MVWQDYTAPDAAPQPAADSISQPAAAAHSTPNTLRYAILEHTLAAQAHWDLLLEQAPDQPLATWKISLPPEQWLQACQAQGSIPVIRLPNHRRMYLDYSGPISNNRGEVRQVQTGILRWLKSSEHHFVALLSPAPNTPPLHYTLEDRGHGWTLRIKPAAQ
ncbi:MAG: hypothetical protein HKL96_03100 [Phycisphaerales bacterium]|nr:hypothetical protein [Phycisphaerales bacterium]